MKNNTSHYNMNKIKLLIKNSHISTETFQRKISKVKEAGEFYVYYFNRLTRILLIFQMHIYIFIFK